MSIYTKLLEVQKTVRGLGKNAVSGTGSSSYQYVTGSKVLDIIRPKMDSIGLLLVPEVESIETERVDYQVRTGAKSEMFTKVMMTFTWIDAETGEKLPVKFGANGQNGWDKGLGSALTYAERYFLLKFFHIATDEDDVDARPNEDASPIVKKRLVRGSKPWNQAVERCAKGENILQKLRDTYIWDDGIEADFTEDVFNFNLDNHGKDDIVPAQ